MLNVDFLSVQFSADATAMGGNCQSAIVPFETCTAAFPHDIWNPIQRIQKWLAKDLSLIVFSCCRWTDCITKWRFDMHFAQIRRGCLQGLPALFMLTVPTLSSSSVFASDTPRLINEGENRLLITESGTQRYTPQQQLDSQRVRYRSKTGTEILEGGFGRYTLFSTSASPQQYVAGARVESNRLKQTLPIAIEQKRPLQSVSTGHLLSTLLLTENTTEDDCPEQCDASAYPPSNDFQAGPSIDEALTIDIRPETCQSYFDAYVGIERGSRIEQALAYTDPFAGSVATVRSFPVVDFIAQGEARVVRSRDLASQSYAEPGSLYERLMRDGRDIEAGLIIPLSEDGFIERTELGRTTRLEASDSVTIMLEVIVQHGMINVDQLDDIRRAASDLASTWGIALRIIEIP